MDTRGRVVLAMTAALCLLSGCGSAAPGEGPTAPSRAAGSTSAATTTAVPSAAASSAPAATTAGPAPAVSPRPPTSLPTTAAPPHQAPPRALAPTTECLIKGNISSSGERIYHVPGQRYYEVTVITPAKGERWFCTEQEAVAAGWRKSKV